MRRGGLVLQRFRVHVERLETSLTNGETRDPACHGGGPLHRLLENPFPIPISSPKGGRGVLTKACNDPRDEDDAHEERDQSARDAPGGYADLRP